MAGRQRDVENVGVEQRHGDDRVSRIGGSAPMH
jgi:hypothetical protein